MESRRKRTRVLVLEPLSMGKWRVENIEVGSRYLVTQEQGEYRCSCKDYETHGFGHYCKHIWAVVDLSFGDCDVKETEK